MMATGVTWIPLTRSEIAKVRTRALRRGVWYRALTRLERACIDVSTRVVRRVRSRLLSGVLCSILSKLHDAMESRVCRLAEEVGRPLACRLSAIAQRWGNKSAVRWVEDSGFIRFLVIDYVNAG